MSTADIQSLFTPLQLGSVSLKHRVVMAPLTRSRTPQPSAVPNELVAAYYAQRASDGGLIVSEATNISLTSRGWYGAPGLWNDEQVEGWKQVVKAVKAKGGMMFSQLWHTGRASHVSLSGVTPVTASVNPGYWQDPTILVSTPTGWQQPSPHRALEIQEIKAIVDDYAAAALRAVAAGFDDVELHGGNGYLIDQFLQDGSNHRTDPYGGSILNRVRLLIEVTEAVTGAVGSDRVGIRIAPGGLWNGMGDSNPDALFDHVVRELGRFNLAYLHVIEPRVKGNTTIHPEQGPIASRRLKKIFKGAVISTGGYEPDSAATAVRTGDADAVAFGKYFVSNPDLVRRIREGFPLTPYNRDTFYTFEPEGYIDYKPYAA
jgi:N-ethylmaleimide reductase